MGKLGGRQRHLDGETWGERRIGTEGGNVAIKFDAGIMAEWEGTTD